MNDKNAKTIIFLAFALVASLGMIAGLMLAAKSRCKERHKTGDVRP